MMTAPYPPVDGTQACATGGTDTAVAAAFLGQPATDTSAAKLACHECAFLRPCRAYGLTTTCTGYGRVGHRRPAGCPPPARAAVPTECHRRTRRPRAGVAM